MRTLVIILCIASVTNVFAQSSLDEYLKIAEQNNPGLKSKMLEFEAAMQVIPQVSSLPDPSFSVSAFGRMVETRVGQQMARFSLSQMFPWFGTLAKQKDAAALAAQAKYEIYLDARNELFFKVRSAYYPIVALDSIINLQKENLEILETFKTLATTRFQNGKGKLADALRVDIMMNDIKTEIQILELKRLPLQTSFNKLLNRNVADQIIIDPLLDTVIEKSFSIDSIENNPKLNALTKQIESSEAKQQVALKNGMPMLGVGFDYIITAKRPGMDFQDNGKDAYMPMVTVTLPIYRKKYKGMANEASYMKQSYQEMRNDAANMLTTEFEMTSFEQSKAKQELMLLKNQVNQTKQVVDLLLAAFGNSESDFEEILDMQRLLLKYEMNRVTAVKEYYMAEAKLRYLTAND